MSAFAQQIEEHHGSWSLLGQQLHSRSGGVYPQLQQFKIKSIPAGNHDLTIKHASFRQLRKGSLNQLREVAVQGFLIPALDNNFGSVTEDQSTKSIPLRLEEPHFALRDFADSLGKHRQYRRVDRKIHVLIVQLC